MMEAWQLQHRKKLSLKRDEDGSSDCRPRKTKRLAAASYYRFGPQCLFGLLPINGGLSGLPAFDATRIKGGCEVIPPNVAGTSYGPEKNHVAFVGSGDESTQVQSSGSIAVTKPVALMAAVCPGFGRVTPNASTL